VLVARTAAVPSAEQGGGFRRGQDRKGPSQRGGIEQRLRGVEEIAPSRVGAHTAQAQQADEVVIARRGQPIGEGAGVRAHDEALRIAMRDPCGRSS
jgi:hypothetical protein